MELSPESEPNRGITIVLPVPPSTDEREAGLADGPSDAGSHSSSVPTAPESDGGIAQNPCGDGTRNRGEMCDDGNTARGDGCVDCAISTGWQCSGEPSSCVPADECVADGMVCDVDATCVATDPSSFSCRCNDGFRGDGTNCAAVATQLSSGRLHSCAVVGSGSVRCWGRGAEGQLGYGNTEVVGDDELPASVGFVDVGEEVTQVAAGQAHTCALLRSGTVRCWGDASLGQLGYGGTESIGDDETPAAFHARLLSIGRKMGANVELSAPAVQVVAGANHNCALLQGGAVRCWGVSSVGQLGYGGRLPVGDDETLGEFDERRLAEGFTNGANVDVGGVVVQLAAGSWHTCALLGTGTVRCWGASGGGQLGYGNKENIGDDPGETPAGAAAGDVQIGSTAPVANLIAGGSQTCVLQGGSLRCWGGNVFHQLGYATTRNIGDQATPAMEDQGAVLPGSIFRQVAMGFNHGCAVQVNGSVRCWGRTDRGRLGFGELSGEKIGTRKSLSALSSSEINLLGPGEDVSMLSAGEHHTCALLQSGAIRCWGRGDWGQLGYGGCNVVSEGQTLTSSTCPDIGDDEDPVSAGTVSVGTLSPSTL